MNLAVGGMLNSHTQMSSNVIYLFNTHLFRRWTAVSHLAYWFHRAVDKLSKEKDLKKYRNLLGMECKLIAYTIFDFEISKYTCSFIRIMCLDEKPCIDLISAIFIGNEISASLSFFTCIGPYKQFFERKIPIFSYPSF